MIESELVEKSAAVAGVSKSLCRQVYDAIKASILEELSNGGTVRMCGMGEFRLKLYPPRTNRHPQTGVLLAVPAKVVPAFAPSKVWKVAVNEDGLAERLVQMKNEKLKMQKEDEPAA